MLTNPFDPNRLKWEDKQKLRLAMDFHSKRARGEFKTPEELEKAKRELERASRAIDQRN
jgi:hypothetical protein